MGSSGGFCRNVFGVKKCIFNSVLGLSNGIIRVGVKQWLFISVVGVKRWCFIRVGVKQRSFMNQGLVVRI